MIFWNYLTKAAQVDAAPASLFGMTAVADLRRRLAVMVRTPAPVGTLHVIVPVVVAAVPVVVIAAVNFSWEDRNSLGAAGALLVAAMLAEAFPLPIEGIKAGA